MVPCQRPRLARGASSWGELRRQDHGAQARGASCDSGTRKRRARDASIIIVIITTIVVAIAIVMLQRSADRSVIAMSSYSGQPTAHVIISITPIVAFSSC